MLPEHRTARQARRILNAALALGASATLLAVLGAGYAAIPALGPALDPGHGAWTRAGGSRPAPPAVDWWTGRDLPMPAPGLLAHPMSREPRP